MELAEVLELRNSRRILDRTDAQIRRESSSDLIALFDWFTEGTRAAGEPRRERLALFAASRPAMVVLVVGAVAIATAVAFLVSLPSPCLSGAYDSGGPRAPAAALASGSRMAIHLRSCQVSENSPAAGR